MLRHCNAPPAVAIADGGGVRGGRGGKEKGGGGYSYYRHFEDGEEQCESESREIRMMIYNKIGGGEMNERNETKR
uniref:Uncharacterized protein n=1 Tax=Bracon brevicornis TaxID=1563983 RepID=A0A6V7KFC8_9HYME